MTTVLLTGGGTGGHLMPLLAIADRLRRAHPEWRYVIAGSKRGIEAQVLPTREYPYHLLPTEPLYRRAWWRNLRWPAIAVRVLHDVRRMLADEKPDLVLGTGGYASGPVLWAAARRSIPTAIWDGDTVPGIASRLASARARHIYLAFPEAKARFADRPMTEVFITGAPIVPPDSGLAEGARERFGLSAGRPVIMITGGGQGALAINRAVAEWVTSGGGEGVHVLWVTGHSSHAEFERLHDPPAVHVFGFLDPIGEAYSVADLAVVRGGTMSLSELCAWGIPGIVIPLPGAAADHQMLNARALEEAGAVVVLPQSDLTGATLGNVVADLLGDADRMRAMHGAALNRSRPEAADEIARRVEGLIRAL